MRVDIIIAGGVVAGGVVGLIVAATRKRRKGTTPSRTVEEIAASYCPVQPGENPRNACKVAFEDRRQAHLVGGLVAAQMGLSAEAGAVVMSHMATQQLWGVYWHNWHGHGVGTADVPFFYTVEKTSTGARGRLRAYDTFQAGWQAFFARIGLANVAWIRTIRPGTFRGAADIESMVDRLQDAHFYGPKGRGARWIAKRKSDAVYHARKYCEYNEIAWPG